MDPFMPALEITGVDWSDCESRMQPPSVITNPRYTVPVPASEAWETWESGFCSAISGRRYYSPSTGRWLSRDTVGECGPDGPNLFGFVANNPINLADPLGLSSVAAPNPFDPCKDPCDDLLDSIKQLARHVRGRYNDMLFDDGGLYGSRYSGPVSWLGHQQQFYARRSQLRDAIQKYNDRGCGQKIPIPVNVNVEADREAPAMPIRFQLSAFDRWLAQRTISNQTLDTMEKGAWGTVAIGLTGLTFGVAGPYLTGGAVILGGATAAAGP